MKVSRRTPIATVAPIWTSSSSGSRVRVAKVPARIRPAPVTTPPVSTSARRMPSRVPCARRLLARPGHQEDVVVDAERDEEDERHQDQVEGDPFARRAGRRAKVQSPSVAGEGEDDGDDQVERRDQRPQHRDQDQARRRAGPAAPPGGCRGRWSARCRSSRPGCRRAGRSGASSCRRSRICSTVVGGVARVGVAAEDDHDAPHFCEPLSLGGTGDRQLHRRSSSIPARHAAPLRRRRPPRSAASRARAGSVRSSTLVPRLESVGSVSPWPKPIVPWWLRLPSGEDEQAGDDERGSQPRAASAQRSRRSRPAPAALRPCPVRRRAAAGQKARSPSTASSAGRRVKAAASIIAIPIARIGPSQWVDSRSATSSTSIAAITVPPEAPIAGTALAQRHAAAPPSAGRPPSQLLAVAVDEQQRVVGAGAEDQHQQQERPLDVDDDPARLDQQVGDADRDHVGGADRDQRQQRQQRRPVDEQQQDEDQARGSRPAASRPLRRRPARGRRRSRPGR